MDQQTPASVTIDTDGDDPKVVVSLEPADVLAMVPADVLELAVARAHNEKLSRHVLDLAGHGQPKLASVTDLDSSGLAGLIAASSETLRGILTDAGVDIPVRASRKQLASLCAQHGLEAP